MRVAVPDLVSNSYFPAVAAVELGLFEDEGLDAEVELIFPVSEAMEALRDGQVDFVAGAAHTTLHAFPGWRGARILAAVAQNMYWFLIVRADLRATRGDLGSLQGLRIGAAPGPDAGLRRLLIDAGVDVQRNGIQIGPIPGTSEPGVSFGVSAARALEAGEIDGFWANGMGAEVAIRGGIGTLVLDARRGDGPPAARHYTFPAFVTTERKIRDESEIVAGAVRALVRAQRVLSDDPERAAGVGQRCFPPLEASLISELVRRDAPFYDPRVSEAMVQDVNRFAHLAGLETGNAAYESVVATEFIPLWSP